MVICFRTRQAGTTSYMIPRLGSVTLWVSILSSLLLLSHWVTSNSLQPHGLQRARLPCPSLSPGVCCNSRPLSRWCHPTISSSVIPFSSCLQSSPASRSFPMSRLFTSGGQSIGASASASVLPVNIQDWFPLGLTFFISLLSKGLTRVFSSTTVQRHQFFSTSIIIEGTKLGKYPTVSQGRMNEADVQRQTDKKTGGNPTLHWKRKLRVVQGKAVMVCLLDRTLFNPVLNTFQPFECLPLEEGLDRNRK